MKQYDFRFNNRIFQSFVGKTFDKYKHRRFVVTNSVAMYAGIMIDGVSYEVENDYEALDFLGWDNETTVFRITEGKWENILSVHPEEITVTDVNQIIRAITIVNDHFSSFSFGIQNYDFWETRAVVFHFDNYDISFAKDNSWFSMEIIINTGRNLVSLLPDGKFILDGFDQSEEQRIEVEREMIMLKQ